MDAVIDTNAYIAYIKNEEWATSVIDRLRTIYVPYVLLGEVHFGANNGTKINENLKTLHLFCMSPRVIVLNTSSQTPKHYGEIASILRKSGKPIQVNDIWIAALCKEKNLPLLTKDKGFTGIPDLQLL